MVEKIFLKIDRNHLVFQQIYSYLITRKDDQIGSLQSKGMSQKSIRPPSTTDISFKREIDYIYGREKMDFKGIGLKQDSVSFFFFYMEMQ